MCLVIQCNYLLMIMMDLAKYIMMDLQQKKSTIIAEVSSFVGNSEFITVNPPPFPPPSLSLTRLAISSFVDVNESRLP